MKERMKRITAHEDGVVDWQCPCGNNPYLLNEGFWPCNENGEFNAPKPCFMHQLEVCCECGRIFNCHTGKVLGRRGDSTPVSIAPEFTDYEYLRTGGCKLPTYKGYVVDVRLWQFRKITCGELPEFIPFDSAQGDALLAELIQKLPKDHLLINEVFEGFLRRC